MHDNKGIFTDLTLLDKVLDDFKIEIEGGTVFLARKQLEESPCREHGDRDSIETSIDTPPPDVEHIDLVPLREHPDETQTDISQSDQVQDIRSPPPLLPVRHTDYPVASTGSTSFRRKQISFPPTPASGVRHTTGPPGGGGGGSSTLIEIRNSGYGTRLSNSIYSVMRTPPGKLAIHPALSPTSEVKFDIDFSLPDVAFKSALSQLGENVLRAPACNPPRESVNLRVASGAYKMRIHVGGYGGAVTVADVLHKLHHTLRERHYDADSSARAYTARRSRNNNEEPETRMVDHLLGHTLLPL
ncbi:hypothetical protein C8F01DRAFT_1087400 [Mycena amicta]|nr:hypothetical protein C8F01DRAFT_1087400 [Mycena amicta]